MGVSGSQLRALRARIRPFVRRHRAAVVRFLLEYLRLPSTHGRELPAQRYVRQQFLELGVPARFIPIPDRLRQDPEYSHTPHDLSFEDRPNVVVRLAGDGGCGGHGDARGRSLILNSHTDVVPADDWPAAFRPRLAGDRLYGRGALDDKGPAGISYLLLNFLRESRVRLLGDLEVQVVLDEEVGGNGTLALLRQGHWADAAVVLESSGLEIRPGHRGALWFRLELTGKSAHMARCHEGVNAIELALEALQILKEYERRLRAQAGRPKLFPFRPLPIQVNIGKIQAGDWPATVPERCVLEGGVGFLPPRTCADVRRELEAILRELGGPWLRRRHRFVFQALHNDPYAIDPRHPLVRELAGAARRRGHRPKVRGAIASSDARLFNLVGKMPVVVFGPPRHRGALPMHGRDENVKVAELLLAAEIVIDFVLEWCGVASAP